ncbi:MAG: RagB/SusD family nutrient uptake outer membrane protein [Tannerella sp.]|nr:RagB/SusD family nutrient uptake outer membrane protein [Tannerella sp.]
MKIKLLLSGICFALCLSCTDVLDKKDLGAISEKDVWNDPLYAKAYLDRLCRDNLPRWNSQAGDASDEAGGGGATMYGQMGLDQTVGDWHYTEIRKINIFLEEIGSGSIDKATQQTLSAQALVLRALRYFQMVRLYGGVPMILKAQDLTEDLYVTRTKTSECIRLIVKDLDDAIAMPEFPWKWSGADAGRISKAAALALKGRILLYWASPQFNPNNDPKRWEDAYAVNRQAAEELEKNGYGLFENFETLWFNEMNEEVILVTRYQDPSLTHNWEAGNRPYEPGMNNSNRNQPTWEMVTAFPMNTGVAIDASNSGYDPVHFWKNRDPRFAATVAYNSCSWALSGLPDKKLWTFAGAVTAQPSNTGFHCRKAVNPEYTAYYAERSSTDWIEIRYAEVLLSYAECAAETGNASEAYECLKKIRARAGILPGNNSFYGLQENLSKENLVKAVMLERKIELAYEDKRHWDLRRRKLFESEMNGKRRHRLLETLLIPRDEFESIKETIDLNTDYATYFRQEMDELDRQYDINFKPEYYFYAIRKEHLEKNSKLEQTQGWEGGTFNPLD